VWSSALTVGVYEDMTRSKATDRMITSSRDGHSRQTALHFAAVWGRKDVVELLERALEKEESRDTGGAKDDHQL
jgi:hypothetical protein